MNKDIKQLILDKNHVYKSYIRSSICRPLKLIFQSCLESGKFPIEWKKVNAVPVHEKGDKQILKNYLPISLLPIAVIHEIYQTFDDSLEARAVFLDISKAFDKVWHKGLIFKLKQNGISENILNIITDFLSFKRTGRFKWASLPLG